MKVIQESTLTNIANAIREKEQSTDPIPLSEFAPRISNLIVKGDGTVSTNKEALALINKAVAAGSLEDLT